MNNHRCAFKVGIVGCGNVGMTAAYALVLKGIPTDLVLIGRNQNTLDGEKLDLEHGLPFMPGTEITASNDYAALKGTDVVLFTAGASQAPGETRLDLAKKNIAIVKDIIPQIREHAPHAVIVMVTNPVDILTQTAIEIADAPKGQIFGSGTLLDTARFRFHLSEFLDVNPRSIHTYILGEHGDSSFPVIASATVGGQKLLEFPNFSLEKAHEAFQMTRDAAYKIIQGKGATYYAIGTVLTHIVTAIQKDARTVMPVSVPLNGQFDIDGVCLSMPCIVGRRGVSQILNIELDATEKKALQSSAKTLKAFL